MDSPQMHSNAGSVSISWRHHGINEIKITIRVLLLYSLNKGRWPTIQCPPEEPRTCRNWYMRSKRVTVSYVSCPSDHTIREICALKTRSSLEYAVEFDVCLIMIENCAIRKQIRKHVRNGPSCASVHYSDVIMSAMASQITGVTIVYSVVCLSADQRKHQRSASLAFERGIHRWPVNSPHKGPVTRKTFPFDIVIVKTFL